MIFNVCLGLFITGLFAITVNHLRDWIIISRQVNKSSFHKKRPSVIKKNKDELVSILLPAWNDAKHLRDCIESIVGLEYPKKEIIICAGGNDHTLDTARHFEGDNIIVIEQYAGDGKQQALQKCYEKSKGSIIFLTDADCVWENDDFNQLIAPLLKRSESVTTGAWQPLQEQRRIPFVIYQWCNNIFAEAITSDYVTSLIGRSCAIRREALEMTGAFHKEALIGTDLVLSKQLLEANYKIRFLRDSRVSTEYSTSVSAYLKQVSRWFRNPILWKRQREPNVSLGIYSGIRSSIGALIMLFFPIFSIIGHQLFGFIWLLALWHLLLALLKKIVIGNRLGASQTALRWHYAFFPGYMILNWIGTLQGLIDISVPARRYRW